MLVQWQPMHALRTQDSEPGRSFPASPEPDAPPGKTSYVGVKEFSGTWYALNASGGAVK
jgi:hypothetical protein